MSRRSHRLEYSVISSIFGIAFASSAAADTSPAGKPADDPPVLALEQIIERALAHNKSLEVAALEVQARAHDRDAVAAKALPTLRAEITGLRWDDEFDYVFDTAPLAEAFAPILPPGSPAVALPDLGINIRDAWTLQSQLMVVQPLTGLVQLHHGAAAKGHMVDAAREDAVAARHEIEGKVLVAFYAHAAAVRMAATVEAALEQIAAFTTQTKAYVDAGLVERDALLKIDVQRAQMEKARFQARKGVDLTRAQLNLYMDRPLDAPFTAQCADDTTIEARVAEARARLEVPLADLQRAAVEARPELRSARQQRAAAEAGRSAVRAEWLPEVNAMVAWQNNQGLGDIMPENAAFGGLMMKWNFWEWGATEAKIDAADVRARQAVATIDAAEDGIALHVEHQRLELIESLEQKTVAEVALTSAVENLRIEEARYAAQETTAADLLAAQTARVRAENDHALALIGVQAAARSLDLATGRDLVPEPE